VTLNTTVSLDKFLAKSSKDDDPLSRREFSLKSVVHHIGMTPNSGHYTVDALRLDPENQEETWVSFDDGSTKETTLESVVQSKSNLKNAYMLMYSLE
jgi:hypothetical protein